MKIQRFPSFHKNGSLPTVIINLHLFTILPCFIHSQFSQGIRKTKTRGKVKRTCVEERENNFKKKDFCQEVGFDQDGEVKINEQQNWRERKTS